MGRNFDDYPSFQPKTTGAFKYAIQCMSLICFANPFSSKAQLISKELVGILNPPKKRTKKIVLQYYDTSGRLVFVRFLGELKTPKSPFEIN